MMKTTTIIVINCNEDHTIKQFDKYIYIYKNRKNNLNIEKQEKINIKHHLKNSTNDGFHM